MGNRDALLAAAAQCLRQKGYARTTARDIASTAGTSLAAIGYHFRTKDALLTEAMIQELDAWGSTVGQALAAGTDPGAGRAQRFEAAWARVIDTFDTHRQLWITQLDLIMQLDHLPAVRERLVAAQREARLGLAELFGLGTPDGGTHGGTDALAAGSLLQVMLGGLLLQWLVDPATAPSPASLTDALRRVATDLD